MDVLRPVMSNAAALYTPQYLSYYFVSYFVEWDYPLHSSPVTIFSSHMHGNFTKDDYYKTEKGKIPMVARQGIDLLVVTDLEKVLYDTVDRATSHRTLYLLSLSH